MDTVAFRRVYQQAVDDILPFLTPDRLAVVARHNPGWQPDKFNHEAYLRTSEVRYIAALDIYASHASPPDQLRTLEVGGFMAAFPLALTRIGVQSTLSEKYGYYYGAFDDLRDFITAEGVDVWDLDLTEPVKPFPSERFDIVTAMAIIEHLAHSPRVLLEQCRNLLDAGGRLVLDTPNLGYWPTRIGALRGRSPMAPIEHVFHADIPFTGHHREYTEAELRAVIEWSGMRVEALSTCNYSPWPDGRWWMRVAADLPRKRVRALRELLLVCASNDGTSAA